MLAQQWRSWMICLLIASLCCFRCWNIRWFLSIQIWYTVAARLILKTAAFASFPFQCRLAHCTSSLHPILPLVTPWQLSILCHISPEVEHLKNRCWWSSISSSHNAHVRLVWMPHLSSRSLVYNLWLSAINIINLHFGCPWLLQCNFLQSTLEDWPLSCWYIFLMENEFCSITSSILKPAASIHLPACKIFWIIHDACLVHVLQGFLPSK